MLEAETNVPFPRRMMALLYDAIAVFTLLYFSTFVPVIAAGGQALASGNPLLTLYLIAVMFGYFGISWTRGRTLGMQAWKITIVAGAGDRYPNWRETLVRFVGAWVALALGGCGYLAALFDVEHRTWHDRWSGTRLIRRPLTANANS